MDEILSIGAVKKSTEESAAGITRLAEPGEPVLGKRVVRRAVLWWRRRRTHGSD